MLETCTDNVIIFSKRADEIMRDIQETYKMKGAGKPELYLGGNMAYFLGSTVMFTSAEKYLTTLLKRLEDNMGGNEIEELQFTNGSRLPPGTGARQPRCWETMNTQSTGAMLVGSAQWAVTLGRADIAFAVSTMARFSAMPKEGHSYAGYVPTLRFLPQGLCQSKNCV